MTRGYIVYDAAANRAPGQWYTLVTGLKTKPMIAALITAAHQSTHNTVHINRFSTEDVNGHSRYMLGDFEMKADERAGLLVVLEAQRVAHGIVDGLSLGETLRRVLQVEMREVATDEGYPPAVVNSLLVGLIGFGQRENAITDAIAWVIANQSDWN